MKRRWTVDILLLFVWFLAVLAAGEYTLWSFWHRGRDGLRGWTLPFMLLGHPLVCLLIGLSGLIGLVQPSPELEPVAAAVGAFTGLTTFVYMVFRFMPSADMLIWGRRWRP